MKKLGKIVRKFKPLAIGGALALGTVVVGLGARMENPKEKEERGWIREIMIEQEQIMGIKHFGEPKILFLDSYQPNNSLEGRVTARYNATDNTIIIYDLREHKEDLDDDATHELGHFYMDKLLENLDKKNIMETKKDKRTKGEKLIIEGVAEYFKLKTQNYRSFGLYCNDFRDCLQEGNKAYYFIGPALVDPILEKNINKGIEILSENIPTDEELKDLPKYQAKILKMMQGMK